MHPTIGGYVLFSSALKTVTKIDPMLSQQITFQQIFKNLNHVELRSLVTVKVKIPIKV